MQADRERMAREVKRVLRKKAPDAFAVSGRGAAEIQSRVKAGMDYWAWMDALADLEVRFSRDLSAVSDKFKIETVDELVDALMNAPVLESLYKN
jgi:hypothetical protein